MREKPNTEVKPLGADGIGPQAKIAAERHHQPEEMVHSPAPPDEKRQTSLF